MGKTNLRNLFHLEGIENGFRLAGEVILEANNAFTFNGPITKKDGEKAGRFTYNDCGEGNIVYK